MAKKQNCSSNESRTPVCLFIESLDTEITENQEQRYLAEIQRESAEALRGYVLCTLAITEQTYLYFRDMNNFELYDMQDSATKIFSKIGTIVEKDKELASGISNACKSLVDLQAKLHEVNNAACTMRNCLISHLDLKDSDIPKESELKSVSDAAKFLNDDGKTSAAALLNSAGIHTFSSVETLTSHGQSLSQNVDDLKALTDQLVNTAMENLTAQQTQLNSVHMLLNEQEFGYFHSTGSFNAASSTKDFVCGENTCPPIGCVEVICKEMAEPAQASDDPASGCYSANDKD